MSSLRKLNRAQFYVLHEEIVKKCEEWLWNQHQYKLLKKTEPVFYGFGEGEPDLSKSPNKNENRSVKYAMLNILKERRFDFDRWSFRRSKKNTDMILFHGRRLKDLAHDYNAKADFINVEDRYLQAFLTVIGEPDLNELVDTYEEEALGKKDFPPGYILPAISSRRPKPKASRRRKKNNVGERIGALLKPRLNQRILHNLQMLASCKWYFYNGDYSTENYTVVRRVFEIEIREEEYPPIKVSLTSPAHRSNYFGELLEDASEEDLIAFTLHNFNENRYIHLRFKLPSENPGSLYLGQYMVTRFHGIYTRTCMIENIPEGITPQPDEFPIGDVDLPSHVNRFFMDKGSNVMRTSRSIYNERSFWRRYEDKKIANKWDLFISAPVLSTRARRMNADEARKEWLEASNELFKQNESTSPVAFEKYESKFGEWIEKWILGRRNRQPFIEYEDFNEQVYQFIDCLSKTFSSIEKKNIYYPWSRNDPAGNASRSPKMILQDEFEIMSNSKVFLLIVPNAQLFSSCWVQAGWAMSLNIPMIIIYWDSNDLPFILQRADSLSKDIVFCRLEPGMSLAKAVNWFRDNRVDQRYFSK